jgi:hypothetical protein
VANYYLNINVFFIFFSDKFILFLKIGCENFEFNEINKKFIYFKTETSYFAFLFKEEEQATAFRSEVTKLENQYKKKEKKEEIIIGDGSKFKKIIGFDITNQKLEGFYCLFYMYF